MVVGVRKRELDGVDDASIPPVCTEESTISARLLTGLLKPVGGATDVVSGGGFTIGWRDRVGKAVSHPSRTVDFSAKADEIFPK